MLGHLDQVSAGLRACNILMIHPIAPSGIFENKFHTLNHVPAVVLSLSLLLNELERILLSGAEYGGPGIGLLLSVWLTHQPPQETECRPQGETKYITRMMLQKPKRLFPNDSYCRVDFGQLLGARPGPWNYDYPNSSHAFRVFCGGFENRSMGSISV